MKGHIRERSPGRWAIILDTRDPADRQAQAQMALVSRAPSGKRKSNAPA